MPLEVFHDLSGEGFQDFASLGGFNFARVYVSDLGMAHPIDVSATPRYVDLGYWAVYEKLFSVTDVPDGYALGQVHWLFWPYEGFPDGHSVASQGVDGFYYNLKTGVVASFWMYAP
jgi:hypothetical protein